MMSGRGRGKELTRPAWMHQPRQPQPTLTKHPSTSTPSDWVHARAADGRSYWYSLSTGQTSWTDPTTASSVADHSKVGSAQTPSSEWKQYCTEDGRTYYYNASTKQTQWSAPAEFVPKVLKSPEPVPSANNPVPAAIESKPSNLPEDTLPEGWAKQSTQDGRTYYYHAVTRETRWEKPAASSPSSREAVRMSGTKRPSASLAHPQSSHPASSLPADWAESCTADGKVYYYNKLTRETSWTVPSAQPDLKRPRITPSNDLRNIVNRARVQKQTTAPKAEVSPRVVRRPRSGEGKPLTDRQAEEYFLRRGNTLKDVPECTQQDYKSRTVTPRTRTSASEEKSFQEMLREKGITERSNWLEVMSRCVEDRRYFLVFPYGRRKHVWMKFCQKLIKGRRRSNILNRRKAAEEFQNLMNVTFSDEPHDVLSLGRCRPESVKRFEADRRYQDVEEKDRPLLIKSFFSARARIEAMLHEKRRKEALENIRKALDARIHPSLLLSKERDDPSIARDPKVINEARDGTRSETPSVKDYEGKDKSETNQYFDEHTSTHDLHTFIEKLSETTIIEKDQIAGLVRGWKRHLDTLVREKRAREREVIRNQQRAYRAAFRNGVEGMIMSGRLPINPKWKDVCDVIAKESFAKTEGELDSRPVDLFEDGVRLFEERVQNHRDEFKKLLKEGRVDITDATTVEELRSTECLTSFLKDVETPVLMALLLDRKRKEGKRRQKEKDRAITDFEDLIRGYDIPVGTSFDSATDSWKDLQLYKDLKSVIGEDDLRKVYDDYMGWRMAKQERRMKRRLEQHTRAPFAAATMSGLESSKRARSSVGHHDIVQFDRAQQHEEENGWAAALSAKPVNEPDKSIERERRKREILNTLSSGQPPASGDTDNKQSN